MTRSETRPRARRGVAQAGRHTRPGPREERALLLLAWAGFLTTAQVAKAARYPSLRRAQRRLRVWLDRSFTRVSLQSGALHLPSIHAPTSKAREYLTEAGRLGPNYPVPRLPRPQKRAHALLVRDVFVAFARADTEARLRLEDFQFENDLARVERFRAARLIPDGIATVFRDGERFTVAVECDTGSETTTTLRKKFASWRRLLDAWRPPRLTLLAVVEREGRRRTLARLMTEAGMGEMSLAVLVDELDAVVDALTWPHEVAARGGRTERRTARVQVVEDVENPGGSRGAFRVLLRE